MKSSNIDYAHYIETYPELNNSELADLIISQNDTYNKRKSVMRKIQRLKQKGFDKTPKPKQNSYSISGDVYLFRIGKATKFLRFDVVEFICREYSMGEDTSVISEGILTNFGVYLSNKNISSVLRILGHKRSSRPLAPHMILEMDDEEIRDYLITCKSSRINNNMEYIAETIADKIDLKINRVIKENGDKHLIVILSDWHVGYQNVDEITDLCSQLKANLMHTVHNEDITDTHVFVIGDMLESMIANMRPQQHLEISIMGADQCVLAARLLAQVVCDLPNLNVYHMSGNHGRLTAKRDEDVKGTGDELVTKFAQDFVGHGNWYFNESEIGMTKIGNFNVVYRHGHNGSNDLVGICNGLGALDNNTIFIEGHFHSILFSEKAHNLIHVRNGSIKKSGSYGKANGYSSRVSQISLTCQGDSIKPNIMWLKNNE